MIRTLKGKIEYIKDDYIVLNNNGIGFRVFMPIGAIDYLSSNQGEVKVYTYMNVREDAMQLFGFLNKDDLELFEMLITVNGIGPKGAINVLSILSGDDLRFAIYSGDSKAISKASGIGKKTAEKCILELKDKISIEDTLSSNEMENAPAVSNDNSVLKEAIEALTSLGYSSSDATVAVRKVNFSDDMSVEDVLKEALKNIL